MKKILHTTSVQVAYIKHKTFINWLNKTYTHVVTNKQKVFGISPHFKRMLIGSLLIIYPNIIINNNNNKKGYSLQWQIHLGLY